MAASFSSYCTFCVSKLASVDAMLPRMKPNSNLPITITPPANTALVDQLGRESGAQSLNLSRCYCRGLFQYCDNKQYDVDEH